MSEFVVQSVMRQIEAAVDDPVVLAELRASVQAPGARSLTGEERIVLLERIALYEADLDRVAAPPRLVEPEEG